MQNWINEFFVIGIIPLAAAAAVYIALMLLARHVIPDRILSPKLVHYIMRAIRLPLGLLVMLTSLRTALPSFELSEEIEPKLAQGLIVLLIMLGGWLAIRGVGIVREIMINAFDVTVQDNLRARKAHTQIRVVEQILDTVIFVLTLAAVLMTFDQLRHLGASLLASAGVLGIILGFAAQKTIATLFAGIQIAITQPIRVDDVVIVEEEWGWIEEITLTYVVVKIWDLRRLVVPITLFLEKPFQNWTRVSADILGSIFIYADYTTPFDALREELRRICEGSEFWDGKVCGLQVTNAAATNVEIRALISARNSPHAWNLRCLVREKMIVFLQENYPECLPRTRVVMEPKSGTAEPENDNP